MACLLKIAFCICTLFVVATQQEELDFLKNLNVDPAKCVCELANWFNSDVAENCRKECKGKDFEMEHISFPPCLPEIVMGPSSWTCVLTRFSKIDDLNNLLNEKDCRPPTMQDPDLIGSFVKFGMCLTEAFTSICQPH